MARAFYLSTAPEFFPVIVGALGERGPRQLGGADVRVIIEKPFGTSLAEARELNATVLGVFYEHRSSGSTTTSARRPCRTCSRSASPTGCSSRSGTATTSPTCRSPPPRTSASSGRAGYYDQAGALRDLVQNHMLQLLTLLCMEPPVTFAADDVRDEKVKVLHAIRAPDRRRRRGDERARPVRAGRRRRRAGRRLPRRSRACRPTRTPRPTRRCAWRSTTGAGRGCRSTCAPASAWRARSPRSR